MLNLVIDIGNTFTKVAIFNNRSIVESTAFETFGVAELEGLLSAWKIDRTIISSVNKDVADLEKVAASRTGYLRFHSGIPAGIHNHYLSPATLGLDRLAAVIGAACLFPGRDCLVIDAGTCITYDFIDSDWNYRGGSISPGLNMRFKAMNNFTGRLPLISPDPAFTNSFGLDTRTSMLSGVQKGVLYEVSGFIADYVRKHPEVTVILSGGDSDFFDSGLKNSIFAHRIKMEPQLVLIGLNEVIHQNTND